MKLLHLLFLPLFLLSLGKNEKSTDEADQLMMVIIRQTYSDDEITMKLNKVKYVFLAEMDVEDDVCLVTPSAVYHAYQITYTNAYPRLPNRWERISSVTIQSTDAQRLACELESKEVTLVPVAKFPLKVKKYYPEIVKNN